MALPPFSRKGREGSERSSGLPEAHSRRRLPGDGCAGCALRGLPLLVFWAPYSLLSSELRSELQAVSCPPPSFTSISVFPPLQPDSPTSWPRGRQRTLSHLKADPGPPGPPERMGFQAGRAPSGSQDSPGRGVWKDPLDQWVPKVSEDPEEPRLARRGLGRSHAPIVCVMDPALLPPSLVTLWVWHHVVFS